VQPAVRCDAMRCLTCVCACMYGSSSSTGTVLAVGLVLAWLWVGDSVEAWLLGPGSSIKLALPLVAWVLILAYPRHSVAALADTAMVCGLATGTYSSHHAPTDRHIHPPTNQRVS
jgi:hypothetical protein